MLNNILQSKTALVTGASSGLGIAFSKNLAADGCNLILVARREDRMETLKREINEIHSVDVMIIPLDLLNHYAPQKLYDRIKEAGKTVDVLINNAGFGIYGKFTDITWEREKEMLELDMVTLSHLTKLFVKDMIERNFGYILQVSSIGAYQPTPLYASYSAAKSFVLSLGEALNYELKDTGVKCTVISPGVTETEFHQVAGQELNLYQRLVVMSSETVAQIGIKAMLKGKPSIVPGRLNAVTVWFNRLVPRRVSTTVAYLLMK